MARLPHVAMSHQRRRPFFVLSKKTRMQRGSAQRRTRAIDGLPEDYRTAVVLSDVHGLRYAEIAEILGIPEGTVKSRLFRGRRILQKKLVNYAIEMGYLKPAARA